MGCTTCNQAYAMPVFQDSQDDSIVMRETFVTTVAGVNGQPYPLAQSLVPAAHFPRGRYSASLRIAGFVRRIDRPTAIEVFNEAMRLYQLNEQPFWFVNIWLNLNLQWIPRVAQKHQIVTVAELEAISHPV